MLVSDLSVKQPSEKPSRKLVSTARYRFGSGTRERKNLQNTRKLNLHILSTIPTESVEIFVKIIFSYVCHHLINLFISKTTKGVCSILFCMRQVKKAKIYFQSFKLPPPPPPPQANVDKAILTPI